MRIALFTDGITPYVIGGMQRHSYYLTKYLARNNVEVDLYHTNQSDLDINKLECFSLNEKEKINSIVVEFPKTDSFPGHYLRSSFKYSERIYEQFLKRRNVDFIYVKGLTGWKILVDKKKGKKLPPIGVNFHGFEMFQKSSSLRNYIQNRFLLREPVKFNVQFADILFSYGGKITSILKKLNVLENKIIEIPTGIDEEMIASEIKSTNSELVFLFIGRNERRKGIRELNKVIKRNIEKHFRFEFIGPIPENNRIRNAKVKYHNVVTDLNELKRIIRSCDVLLCPSYSEGMPNVIVEGMASGLAIIATDVGAVSELVSNQNGWLIEPGNQTNLESAFLMALSCSKSELDNKKCKSIEVVKQKFLWNEVIKNLLTKINNKISEMVDLQLIKSKN